MMGYLRVGNRKEFKIPFHNFRKPLNPISIYGKPARYKTLCLGRDVYTEKKENGPVLR